MPVLSIIIGTCVHSIKRLPGGTAQVRIKKIFSSRVTNRGFLSLLKYRSNENMFLYLTMVDASTFACYKKRCRVMLAERYTCEPGEKVLPDYFEEKIVN